MEVIYQSAHIDCTNRDTTHLRTSLCLALPTSASSFRLHARQLRVHKLLVNGLEARFTLVDPLNDLLRGEANHYRGDTLDGRYRSALEISREGELEVEIPMGTVPSSDPLPAIPCDAPKAVRTFHSALQTRLNEALSLSDTVDIRVVNEQPLSTETKDPDKPTLSRESSFVVPKRHGLVVWVTIVYSLESQGCLSGLKVRDNYVYSASGSSLLDDVDGVRCWLPCCDSPISRTCFDVTITTPTSYEVACSGKVVSTEVTQGKRSTRFITCSTIPAFSLGFFAGKVQRFNYSLYKVHGAMWVASEGRGWKRPSSAGEHTDEEESDEEDLGDKLRAVRHTTLGLDLGCRTLHKLTGRVNHSDTYTSVFVPELGRSSLTFHGLSLIDRQYLHTSEQVYMETPVHLLQLTAYLYCWLKSAVRIDSFGSAFLIHGIVGYCINCYVDHVYGEDSGAYRFQKMCDAVIGYERIGRGLPLGTAFPEMHERFDPAFEQFQQAKATVLFLLMENKVGDRDLMRSTIMASIHSAFLVIPADTTRDKRGVTSIGTTIFRLRSNSEGFGDSAPPTPFLASSTPQIYNSTPFIGNSTPFISADHANVMGSPAHSYDKDVFPVPKRSERAMSIDFAATDPLDSYVSGADFISAIRKKGGLASTLEENFIDKYVNSSGIALFRTVSTLTGRDDTKVKLLHINIEQLRLNQGVVSKPFLSHLGTQQVRIFGTADELHEGSFAFRSSNETYTHQIQVKRQYGPKPGAKKPGIEGVDALTLNLDEKIKRSALETARSEDLPVKTVEIDPYVTSIREVFSASSHSYMVERLHKEVDALDTQAHTQALRELGRSLGPVQAIHEAARGYCIQSTKKTGKSGEEEIGSVKEKPIELPLSVFARAEAMYALAKWQIEKSAKLDSDESEWEGRAAIMDVLTQTFVDGETKLPYRLKLDNESLTYLRNATLCSLSLVQSRNGQTPLVVVKHLVNFLENLSCGPPLDESSSDSVADTLDDSHYKAVLLLCVSRIKLSNSMKNARRIIKKILELACAVSDADQAAAWTQYRLGKSSHPHLPGGGCLSANVINCVAEMEVQELLLCANDEAFDMEAKSPIDYEKYFRSYSSVSSVVTPPLVRSAALEAFIRVLWCKQHLSRLKEIPTADYSSRAVNAICDVINLDQNLQVRQSAALALQYVVQYRPPRAAASGLSFGEYMSTLDLPDPRGFCQLLHAPRLAKQYKDIATATDCGEPFKAALMRLWSLIVSGPTHDQGVRSSLLSCWMYCFQRNAPPSLAAVDPIEAEESVYPSEILAACQNVHMMNPNDVSARVDRVLKYGLDKAGPGVAIKKREDGAAPVAEKPASSGPSLKLTLKRTREDNDEQLPPLVVVPVQPSKKLSIKFVMSAQPQP